GKEVPNIVAKMDVGAEKDVAIVSHYDVVPAEGPWTVDNITFDPFDPVEHNGKIYGRGASDNKSGVACTLAAFKELAGKELRYNPVAVIVGDEEVGGTGIREVLDLGLKVDGALILDSLADYVEVGATGVVNGWIRVYGKGGHAGYPHLCINPVWGISKLIVELKQFASQRAAKILDVPAPPGAPIPKMWGRFSVTMLRAGSKHNVIPNMAEAGFDLRIIPGEPVEEALDELISYFNKSREKLDLRAELIIDEKSINTGWLTDKDHPIVREAYLSAKKAYDEVYVGQGKEFQGLAAGLGADDGYYFSNKGIPTVGFGPIRVENNIHGKNEFVYINDLLLVIEFLKNFFSESES
ncbi:MAG: M20/M25/M40 family metallo-hydrolase, partial [Candidatus Korarchaeota archaeon]|nr:M20/M25/M40 family metallo-hydrolase [Candidatus Korarchaeota archaeon]